MWCCHLRWLNLSLRQCTDQALTKHRAKHARGTGSDHPSSGHQTAGEWHCPCQVAQATQRSTVAALSPATAKAAPATAGLDQYAVRKAVTAMVIAELDCRSRAQMGCWHMSTPLKDTIQLLQACELYDAAICCSGVPRPQEQPHGWQHDLRNELCMGYALSNAQPAAAGGKHYEHVSNGHVSRGTMPAWAHVLHGPGVLTLQVIVCSRRSSLCMTLCVASACTQSCICLPSARS